MIISPLVIIIFLFHCAAQFYTVCVKTVYSYMIFNSKEYIKLWSNYKQIDCMNV